MTTYFSWMEWSGGEDTRASAMSASSCNGKSVRPRRW